MLLKDPEQRISCGTALTHNYFLEQSNKFFQNIPEQLLNLYQNKFESQELDGL